MSCGLLSFAKNNKSCLPCIDYDDISDHLLETSKENIHYIIFFFIFFRPHELFNWLFALDDRDYETWDKGRISWHVRYQRAAARTQRPVETQAADAAMMKDQPDLDMDKHQDDDELVTHNNQLHNNTSIFPLMFNKL